MDHYSSIIQHEYVGPHISNCCWCVVFASYNYRRKNWKEYSRVSNVRREWTSKNYYFAIHWDVCNHVKRNNKRYRGKIEEVRTLSGEHTASFRVGRNGKYTSKTEAWRDRSPARRTASPIFFASKELGDVCPKAKRSSSVINGFHDV